MKKYILLLATLVSIQSVSSQAITTAIDEVTTRWDEEAETLSTYEGLRYFCENKEYRYETIQILRDIHHYDSVLYSKLIDAQRLGNHDHVVKKTIKEIEEFEEKYSMKEFISFLRDDCKASKELEKEADNLRKDSGEGAYDNQVYVLEVELGRFVHHITKRVDQIREHVHHIYN